MEIGKIHIKRMMAMISKDIASLYAEPWDSSDNNQKLARDLSNKIGEYLQKAIGEKLDINYLSFKYDLEVATGKLTYIPNNFITALWLNGVNISPKEITEDEVITKTATYRWKDGKLEMALGQLDLSIFDS